MNPSGGRPLLAWRIAFVLSIVACALAVLFAGSVLLVAFAGEAGSASNPGTGTGPAPRRGLTYTGVLPAGLEDLDLKPAPPAATADLAFDANPPAGSGFIHRAFVPVVSFNTGLYAVSRQQLDDLLAGRLSFVALGGYGGIPTYAAVAAALPALATVVPAAPAPAVTFNSYDELRAAFADPALGPFVGFIPLAELRPSVPGLAVGGIDPLVSDTLAAWPFAERLLVTPATERARTTAAAITARLEEPRPTVTRIVAAGDILLSRCSLARIEESGDWAAPFRGVVGGFLAGADLAIGSLDGSIQDIGEPYRCVPTTNLTSPPEVVEGLQVAGFDELTLATNHIADCGEGLCGIRALQRTIELLDVAGIRHVGAGSNIEEALAPVILDVNGIRIGILGFDDIAAEDIAADETSAGTAPLDDSYDDEQADLPREPAFYKPASMLSLDRFTDRIRRLRTQVDVVIVQVQSGYEDTHDPSPRSLKALRAAAAAGADLVLGNQAHWAGAVEMRGDVFVTYAMGNFVFDQVHTPEHTQGFLVEAIVRGNRVAGIRLLPYRIEGLYRPEFAGAELRAKIFADVYEAAERLPVSTP